jgi:hypothetical protein
MAVTSIIRILYMIQQNSYPMKEWHLENMKKRVVKYVTGLSDDATSWQKKQHRKYGGNIANLYRSIDFDIRHGVTNEEVLVFLDKVRNDPHFSNVRDNVDSIGRLNEIQSHFTTSAPAHAHTR